MTTATATAASTIPPEVLDAIRVETAAAVRRAVLDFLELELTEGMAAAAREVLSRHGVIVEGAGTVTAPEVKPAERAS